MTPDIPAPAVAPRNALVAPVPQHPVLRPAPAAPSNLPLLLANAIGHAAMLADTPAKWASTIAMLRRHGVDPQGYEDFDKGRTAAMAAAGIAAPQDAMD